MYFLFYKFFHRKFKITNNILIKNKDKNVYFKKFRHSEALFSMVLMGHHSCLCLCLNFVGFFEFIFVSAVL